MGSSWSRSLDQAKPSESFALIYIVPADFPDLALMLAQQWETLEEALTLCL